MTSDCTAGNASVFNERQHQRGLHITEDKSASADSHVAVHSQAATDNSIGKMLFIIIEPSFMFVINIYTCVMCAIRALILDIQVH